MNAVSSSLREEGVWQELITAIELGNVRVFEGDDWTFHLSPLTVLCGTNSAGKSTLLKVLLLLRQTMGIREALGTRAAKLRFVGSQVDLGNYRSFVSHNEIYRDLSIGLTLDGAMPEGAMSQLNAREGPQASLNTLLDSGPDSEAYSLRCAFRFGYLREQTRPRMFAEDRDNVLSAESADSKEARSEEDIEEPSSSDEPQPILKSSNYEIIQRGKVLLSWSVAVSQDANGPFYRMKLPVSYLEKGSGLKGIVAEQLDLHGNAEFITVLRGTLPDRILGRISETPENLADDIPWRSWPLPVHIERALRDLRRGLANIQYLGPLRSAAKRYYTAQVDPDPVLDPAGDFLPYLLRDRGEMGILNLRIGETEARREPLAEALDYWLHYLRTGSTKHERAIFSQHELKLQTVQDVLVQLAVRSLGGSESHALADSGFGYSQVLPILARGLITTPGSTLIVEQPEVHLNPALQTRVADFLVAMARAGKQILVETHSEHVVNAVRVLSAEDETGHIASECTILYLEATGGKPNVHELSVKRDGTVPEWPRHFFGEAATLTGRLLRAQKKFRGGMQV
ncbi:MAG: AAA family ATPase [Candidatus Korobacteraceae bacterium]